MHSHLWRSLKHQLALTVSIVLLGTTGAVLGTTGVLAGTIGLPLGASTVCGCTAAFEGPSWWVKAGRLDAGTKKIKTVANTAFTLETTNMKTSCTTANYTGEIVGSAANNVGTDNGTLTLTGCTVQRPTGCEVKGASNNGKTPSAIGEIGPIPVETTLVFPRNGRANAYDYFFSLEKEVLEKNSVFTNVRFLAEKGKTCTLNTGTGLEIKGLGAAAQLQKSAGASLGSKEEEKIIRLAFTTPPLTEIEEWRPAESRYAVRIIGLEFQSETLALVGTVNTELETTEKFGWTNG